MSQFVNCGFIEQETENGFHQKLLRLKIDKYCDSQENSLNIKQEDHLDAVHSIRLHKQKAKNKS